MAYSLAMLSYFWINLPNLQSVFTLPLYSNCKANLSIGVQYEKCVKKILLFYNLVIAF